LVEVLGEEIGYAFMNGVINPALFAGKYSFEYLVLILFTNGEPEVPFAYGAAEDIE
jgi:hypothetical protein